MVCMLQDFILNAGEWMLLYVPVELLSNKFRYFRWMHIFINILDTVKELI